MERFSRYVHAIATQAYRLTEPDAEDVFQEVFARAYEHLDHLRDDGAIRPWLGQLTRRLAIDRLRAGTREAPDDDAIEIIDARASEQVARIEQTLSVHQAMTVLPETCREILDRFFARDESYSAIAQALDIPMGTVASRISRCLSRLREEFGG